jgi:hypothetical protein
VAAGSAGIRPSGNQLVWKLWGWSPHLIESLRRNPRLEEGAFLKFIHLITQEFQ